MKPHGSTSDFTAKRDSDLLRAYRDAIACARHVRLDRVLQATVNSPAQRFYVSEERAAIVLSQMFRGQELSRMKPQKREMFQEIFRRAQLLRQQHPERSIAAIAATVVNQPAPKFYLTPQSAKVIIHRIRHKRKRN